MFFITGIALIAAILHTVKTHFRTREWSREIDADFLFGFPEKYVVLKESIWYNK